MEFPICGSGEGKRPGALPQWRCLTREFDGINHGPEIDRGP
jgi:hypothetical protein